MKNNQQDNPMACKLTAPELRERKEQVIARLKEQVLEKKDVPDGYSYKFPGTDEMLDSLTTFIKSERLCCDFFNFSLSVNNDSFIWLEISGAEGVKEFIRAELDM